MSNTSKSDEVDYCFKFNESNIDGDECATLDKMYDELEDILGPQNEEEIINIHAHN